MLGDHKVSGMIAVSDMDQAKEFYGSKLGMEVVETSGATFVKSGDGMVGLYPSEEFAGKNPATSAGWAVGDLEAEVDELNGKGVTMEQYPQMETNEKGISEAGGGKAAWFKDPDGNILAMFQAG